MVCMTTIKKFIDDVGRRDIAELGFRQQEISRALRDGVFPSGWFPYLRKLCKVKDVELPEHLFRWSKIATTPPGSKAQDGEAA